MKLAQFYKIGQFVKRIIQPIYGRSAPFSFSIILRPRELLRVINKQESFYYFGTSIDY